jgi:hypothetical protein
VGGGWGGVSVVGGCLHWACTPKNSKGVLGGMGSSWAAGGIKQLAQQVVDATARTCDLPPSWTAPCYHPLHCANSCKHTPSRLSFHPSAAAAAAADAAGNATLLLM